MSAPPVRRIGPVDVAVRTSAQAIAEIRDMVARHEGGNVAFANQHSINVAHRDPKVARVLADALVLNDGVGLEAASLILHGERFPENLNGTDLTPAILAALPPARIYLVGSKPGVAETAMAILAERHPRHRFVGAHHGFAKGAEWDAVIRDIEATDAELVLLGMGNPYQDHWVDDHGGKIRAVILSIGAFLDFTAGIVPRAPALMRKTRLEWVYRLAMEPRRMFGRYITGGAVFLGHVLRQKMDGGAGAAEKVSKGN